MPQEPDKVQRDAGSSVSACDQQQRDFRIIPNYCQNNQNDQNQDARLLFAPRQILETVKADGAGHQACEAYGEKQPRYRPPPIADGTVRVKRMHDGGDHASCSGRRHSYEEF